MAVAASILEAAGMPCNAMTKTAQRNCSHFKWRHIGDDGGCEALGLSLSEGQKSIFAALKAITKRQNGGEWSEEGGVFSYRESKSVALAILSCRNHARTSRLMSEPAVYEGSFRLPPEKDVLNTLQSDEFIAMLESTSYPLALAQLVVVLRVFCYLPRAELDNAAIQMGGFADGRDAYLVLGATAEEIKAAWSAENMRPPSKRRELRLDPAHQPFLQAWIKARGDQCANTLLPLRQRASIGGKSGDRGMVWAHIVSDVLQCFSALQPDCKVFADSSPIKALRGLAAAALDKAKVPRELCVAGRLKTTNVMDNGVLKVGRALSDGR